MHCTQPQSSACYSLTTYASDLAFMTIRDCKRELTHSSVCQSAPSVQLHAAVLSRLRFEEKVAQSKKVTSFVPLNVCRPCKRSPFGCCVQDLGQLEYAIDALEDGFVQEFAVTGCWAFKCVFVDRCRSSHRVLFLSLLRTLPEWRQRHTVWKVCSTWLDL